MLGCRRPCMIRISLSIFLSSCPFFMKRRFSSSFPARSLPSILVANWCTVAKAPLPMIPGAVEKIVQSKTSCKHTNIVVFRAPIPFHGGSPVVLADALHSFLSLALHLQHSGDILTFRLIVTFGAVGDEIAQIVSEAIKVGNA